MINLSLRRYLPEWFRSETGDFYLTILFAAGADLLVPLAALVAVWYGASPRGACALVLLDEGQAKIA
jgi:hypothetical protein